MFLKRVVNDTRWYHEYNVVRIHSMYCKILNRYCIIFVFIMHGSFQQARVYECFRERTKCKIKYQYNEVFVLLYAMYVTTFFAQYIHCNSINQSVQFALKCWNFDLLLYIMAILLLQTYKCTQLHTCMVTALHELF